MVSLDSIIEFSSAAPTWLLAKSHACTYGSEVSHTSSLDLVNSLSDQSWAVD